MKLSYITFLVLLNFLASHRVYSQDLVTVKKEIKLTIEEIEYDKKTMTLKIDGHLPNRCVNSPKPTLEIGKNENSLILSVTGEQIDAACISIVGGPYALAFDVRTLKTNISDLELNPNGKYTLIAADTDFVLDIDFSTINSKNKFAKFKTIGEILTVENGGIAIVVVSESETFQIKSPFIDLKNFNGEISEVQGFVLKNSSPVLVPGVSESPYPTILVTGISAATL